jgi:hypothetical protein
MKLFNKMALICNESLDPGLEPLADFCHGVPLQGAHQRLHRPQFCYEALHRPITQRRRTQNSPKS